MYSPENQPPLSSDATAALRLVVVTPAGAGHIGDLPLVDVLREPSQPTAPPTYTFPNIAVTEVPRVIGAQLQEIQLMPKKKKSGGLSLLSGSRCSMAGCNNKIGGRELQLCESCTKYYITHLNTARQNREELRNFQQDLTAEVEHKVVLIGDLNSRLRTSQLAHEETQAALEQKITELAQVNQTAQELMIQVGELNNKNCQLLQEMGIIGREKDEALSSLSELRGHLQTLGLS